MEIKPLTTPLNSLAIHSLIHFFYKPMKLFQQYYFFNTLLIKSFHIILFSHTPQDKPFFIRFLLIKYQLKD